MHNELLATNNQAVAEEAIREKNELSVPSLERLKGRITDSFPKFTAEETERLAIFSLEKLEKEKTTAKMKRQEEQSGSVEIGFQILKWGSEYSMIKQLKSANHLSVVATMVVSGIVMHFVTINKTRELQIHCVI